MKQLSGTDAMFLQFEQGNNHMHVASLAIYDPSTAPGGGVRFKDVLRFFTTRIAEFPHFRRRLVQIPLSLDRPYWIEDDSIMQRAGLRLTRRNMRSMPARIGVPSCGRIQSCSANIVQVTADTRASGCCGPATI